MTSPTRPLRLGPGVRTDRNEVRVNCDNIGKGYGLPTNGMRNAIKLLAKTEGLLFDPVYSGKGLDGMIDLIGRGYFCNMEQIVFLHNRRSVAVFGYPDAFDPHGFTD